MSFAEGFSLQGYKRPRKRAGVAGGMSRERSLSSLSGSMRVEEH